VRIVHWLDLPVLKSRVLERNRNGIRIRQTRWARKKEDEAVTARLRLRFIVI
jgi:hypothetical protein